MVLFLAALTCTVTYAQKKDTTSTHAKKNIVHAKAKPAGTADSVAKAHRASAMKQVGLTKDQQAKIKTANKDYRNKAQKVKNDTTLSANAKKAKLKELNKEKKKQVDTVLTADQKNKLKEIHKQNKANSPQKSKPSPKTKTAG